MLQADLHTHTSHSHAKNSVAEMFAAAQKKGLKFFGFSEHSPRPAGYSYPEDYQEKLAPGFAAYVREVLALKAARPQKAEAPTPLLGMELDFFPAELAFARELCNAYPFDYVIGGLHFQQVWGFDFAPEDWQGRSESECFAIYDKYYQDMATMCATGLFNIAAHPDLIKIFSREVFTRWLGQSAAQNRVRAALEAMKASNTALEISSAGLRKPCREIYPGPEIMRAAAALGLPVVLSSDAHNTEDVAFAFDQLEAYARSFGYTSSLVFVNRQPIRLEFQDNCATV